MTNYVNLDDFTGGEITPNLSGRTSWQGYPRSCLEMENWVPRSTGIVTTRPGSKYLGLTKSGLAGIIVPFIISDGEGYLIEFTALLIRVWHNDALVANAFAAAQSEHATSYTLAHLPKLKFCQVDSKLYVTHKSYAPQVITWSGTYFDITTPTIVGNAGQLPFQTSGNYPGYCAAFGGRLWFMGTTNNPRECWATRSGIYSWGYAWQATYNYEVDDQIQNSSNVYRCITRGTSAGSGGPTTTSSDITDGTVHWAYWCAAGNLDFTYFDTRHVTDRVMDDVSTWTDPDVPEFTDVTTYEDVVGASNAMDFELDTMSECEEITGAIAGAKLVIGTASGEHIIEPDISAINPTAKIQSRYGMETVQGFVFNDSMLFLQSYGTRLREYKYDSAGEVFKSPDLTFHADHIMGTGGAVDMDIAVAPEPMIYCVRTDGELAVLLWNTTMGVAAWHRYVDGGTTTHTYESVAVLPGTYGDAVYVIVNRGTGYRCIEKFDLIGDNTSIPLDSWVDVATAGATVTGLERLNGKTASIWNVTESATYTAAVAAGSLTTPAACVGDHIVVGLAFTCTLKTTKLVTANQTGTTQMAVRSVSKLRARVLNCYPFKVGYDSSYLQSIPITGPATEDVECPFTGNWTRDTWIMAVQDTVRHSTILAFVAEVET